MALKLIDLPGGIGGEVTGLDAELEIAADDAKRLRDWWRERGVLLFRGAAASPDALLRLSRCFGELEPHPVETFRLDGYPDLIELSNRDRLNGPVYEIAGERLYGLIPWHSDLAFTTRPNAAALLRMVKRAETGGRTAWLDTAAAYEAMDEGLKRRIDGVEARFEFCADLDDMRFCNPGGTRIGETSATFPDYPPIARPLVWRHPETGRAILNLCPLNIREIVGMGRGDGDALIAELIAAVVQPRFVYEHDWAENDVILWDNYRMMHCARGHPPDVLRTVQRSTLKGAATIGRILAGEEAGAPA